MTTFKSYHLSTAEEIFNDVTSTYEGVKKNYVENIEFVVFSHVYPSHKFRTTSFVLKNLKELVPGKTLCDMGCGPGIVGLYALTNGATKVTQVDINPYAIENALENNRINGFTSEQTECIQSDCFDNVPERSFDLIVFNMPYHDDNITIEDPLQNAFYDPKFKSIKKFLGQVRKFSHKDTQIFVAFSNKGNIEGLETVFDLSGLNWELWKITNTDQEYDNRIYRLHANA